jgi:hypothetical protein
MPEISRFYGIRITMNTNDHPPPHFHAEYGEHEAALAIASGEVIVGSLPARSLRLVQEWWALHQAELAANWERIPRGEPLSRIAPL